MNIFAFYITYLNMVENREETEHGFICGQNMGDAIQRIEEMYEMIIEIHVTAFEGFDCGIVEKDALDDSQAWFQRMEQA